MSIEESLFTRLSTHAGLSALVSARIYPLILPQKPTLPAVTYTRVSGERVSAMGADTVIARPRFQVSCFASTYASARAVAAQVRAALQRWRGTVGGVVIQDSFIESEIDLYEDDTKLYHTALDFEIIHEE